jgi:hypothetical protein
MGWTGFDSIVETDRSDIENITTDTTLDDEDVGKLFKITASTDVTITLPATVVGYKYDIVNWKDRDGSIKTSISPESNDKIMGIDNAGTDNKDVINTKATSQKGDSISLFGDGSAGWYILRATGTWSFEE